MSIRHISTTLTTIGSEQLRLSTEQTIPLEGIAKYDVLRTIKADAEEMEVLLWDGSTNPITDPQLAIIAVDPDGTLTEPRPLAVEIRVNNELFALNVWPTAPLSLAGFDAGQGSAAAEIDHEITRIRVRNNTTVDIPVRILLIGQKAEPENGD